jgi:hypothetical protein
MQIVSDPPGAHIFIDGQKLGTTPGNVQFDFYGTREVAIYKPGYHVMQQMETISPPWFEIFPLDLFFELCWPFTLRDEHLLNYAMTPSLPLPRKEQQALLERARELRDRAWSHESSEK